MPENKAATLSLNNHSLSAQSTDHRRPVSLKFQLMGWLIGVTLPLMAVAVAGLTIYAARQVQVQDKTILAASVGSFAKAVSIWQQDVEMDIRYMASQPDLASMDPTRQVPALKLLVRNYPWIRYAHVTLPSGVNCARNDGQPPIDYHDRDWFQHALGGAISWQLLPKARSTGQPAVNAAAPIRDAGGRVAGVLALGVALDSLAAKAGAVKFGQSGYLLLVDEHGLVLGRPGLSASSEAENRAAFPPVRRLLIDHAAGFLDFTDEQAQRWLSFAQLTANGWGALAIQKQSEVLAPVYRTMWAGVGAFLLVGLVECMVIWFLSRELVLPIRRLTRAMRQVTAAGWQDHVPISSNNEIATLARTFNDMVDKLRQSRRDIETTVAELRESESRFRLLVEGVKNCALVMLDPQGCVTTWNTGAQRLLGYTAEEITGQDFARFYLPEELAVDKPLRNRIIAAEKGQYADEGWRVRKDGSRFWAAVTISTVRDASGELRGLATLTSDMTERKRAEELLQAAKRSAEYAKAMAEQASKAKDHFMAVLSHELRNPLNPVLATATMLRDNPRFDADTREQLDVICRNAAMEARLIDDLLDVTRIERGKMELDRRPVPIDAILHRAMEVCMPEIQAKQLQFDFEAPGEPCIVSADAARLQQVFWNLLKNAVKFTPPGGQVRVRRRLDSDGWVVVEIQDRGEGMEPVDISRIFHAFEQTSRNITRQFGGLGLGLTISKGLVEMHGGGIRAESPGKGKGSTFTVRLPAMTGEAKADVTVPPQASAPVARSLRILLVEDHVDTARIMRRLLAAKGHAVQIAGDVASALQLAEKQAFDLLLSDLGLPDGSGLDLMIALRAKGLNMPAIALSGYGQEGDIEQSRKAGFTAHMIKPVNVPLLEETIARITS